MPSELSDSQVKAAILEFLVKKGRWGAHYYPVDTIVNWMGRKVRRNGKRVRHAIKDLVHSGFLLVHKKGKTISLNSAKSKEIMEFLKTQAV